VHGADSPLIINYTPSFDRITLFLVVSDAGRPLNYVFPFKQLAQTKQAANDKESIAGE
jgi:hypothetical protein